MKIVVVFVKDRDIILVIETDFVKFLNLQFYTERRKRKSKYQAEGAPLSESERRGTTASGETVGVLYLI